MRVLLVVPMPPDSGAPSAIPVLLAAELEGLAARHDVTVVAVAGPEPAELEAVERLRADGFEVHAAERRVATGRDLWVRRRRLARGWLGHGWPIRTAWFWEPEVQLILDRLAAGDTFDAVVAEDNATAVYRLPPAPVRLLTEHEVRRPRLPSRPPGPPSRWPEWALLEADWRRWRGYQRRVWPRFDVLQVFTERDRTNLVALAPDLAARVRVNPFPVTVPAPGTAPEEPDTVAFLGNFTHPPNVDAAVWLARVIMPIVRAERPGARLWLAGPYAPPEVRALAGAGVEVLGVVPDAEALMRRAAVVAAPVRLGGGMRMKVLHAMAVGRAVVTTSLGTDGLASDGGPLPVRVADDAAGVARSLADLLADDAGRAALGARARQVVVAHHSPAAYVARLEAALDGCVRGSRTTVRREWA